MKNIVIVPVAVCLFAATGLAALAVDQSTTASPTSTAPQVPAFSVDYMDRSVSPGTDFYKFAVGEWSKNNPVPADKSRWAAFSELAERNWYLIPLSSGHYMLNANWL